ncbi:uncharacterized protein LOC127836034 [Dreissena polymorpha]|uniref:Uncharacterized protein n=1 Tax=Dreissena polymorpha TaxID=45954 RepID=A0A9D4GFS9_DREPO|nr:uncharacterized protein LOC127836034 [Dreissena polymorpha]KAH3815978.1 hypothetical protein DPMN_144518 [Dreissena polymorpha]
MADSQLSCASCSTVPPELTCHQDPDFHEELELVGELYFDNNENDGSDDCDSCSDIDNDCNENVNSLNESNYLDTEGIKQQSFKINGCGCTRLYSNKPCSSVVNWGTLISYRLSCLEKSKQELDLIVKYQIFNHTQSGPVTVGLKRKAVDRKRQRQNFYFAGQVVCRNTFAFAHGVSKNTIISIGSSIDVNSLEARVHGNNKKLPKHTLKLQDVQMVKTFLENYSSQNGMPLPGRTPQANEKCILLPSDKNKSDIYELYCGALDRTGQKQVGPSTFRKIWLEQCPYLLVMKPATDLCLKCQKHVENITKSGNITEEEKQIKLENYQKHLEKVKCQRDYYREQCDRTKLEFDQFSDADNKRGILQK